MCHQCGEIKPESEPPPHTHTLTDDCKRQHRGNVQPVEKYLGTSLVPKPRDGEHTNGDTDRADGEEKSEQSCALLHRVVSRSGMPCSRTIVVSRLLMLWWGVMDGFSTADRAAVGLLKPRSLHTSRKQSTHDEKQVAQSAS
jgi:hypothetical protein